MSKDYLKFLKSKSKKFSKNKLILDIILYGSSVKGKLEPEDVDILVIFEKESLNKRLSIAREFKELIKNNFKKIDIRTINFSELLDENFLARQGIIIEGISLIHNKSFSERFGFLGYYLFNYHLKNLSHNEKTKFTYALIGRNSEGMIKKLNVQHLGKGAMMVSIENALIFEDFLKKWNVNYGVKKILVSLI